MKVIFLDIDGVLINRESCRAGFGKVDADCVATLNELVRASDADIVVSSCWRIGRTVAELRDLLYGWGVRGLVYDKTPHDYDVKRGQEIQWWLDREKSHNHDVESFVILDDDADMVHLLPRLVQTEFEVGLTPADAQRALQVLSDCVPLGA